MIKTKKGNSPTTRIALIFGDPCRDRTDNLLIKSYLYVVYVLDLITL